MEIEKVHLEQVEKPHGVINTIPKLNTKLLLQYVENPDKLRSKKSGDIDVDIPQSSSSNLEKAVEDALQSQKEREEPVEDIKEDEGYEEENEETQYIPNSHETQEINNNENNEEFEDYEQMMAKYKEMEDLPQETSRKSSIRDDISRKSSYDSTRNFYEDPFKNQIYEPEEYQQDFLPPPPPFAKSQHQQTDRQFEKPPEDDIPYDAEEDEVEEPEKPKIDAKEERSELLWSLKLLKKYQDVKNFPPYDEFTSTEELRRILKEVKRESILDDNINQTKQYITMIWWGVEKVCTEYLSIDLSGFTAHESQHMSEYHKVLVEIGERSYLNWSEGLPPEVKLLYLVIVHAALFHIKKDTSSVGDIMKMFDPTNKGGQGEMRGPSKIF